MASTRQSLPSDPAAGGGDEALRARRAADDAQMSTASTERDEAAGDLRDGSSPEPADGAPTVGKTSERGARAERPSPVSERRQAMAPPVEASHRGKPPAETPKSSGGGGRPSASGR